MDQSEFEVNTCNGCQAREKACERGTIDRAQKSKTKAHENLLSTLN